MMTCVCCHFYHWSCFRPMKIEQGPLLKEEQVVFFSLEQLRCNMIDRNRTVVWQ